MVGLMLLINIMFTPFFNLGYVPPVSLSNQPPEITIPSEPKEETGTIDVIVIWK